MNGRKLALRREVLSELTDTDLAGLAGGTKTTVKTTYLAETLYSCMTFISCYVPFCLIDRETMLVCAIDVETIRC